MIKLIPAWLADRIRKKRRRISKFREMPVKEVFTRIYRTNHWGSPASISGPGSNPERAGALIKGLENLFEDLKIRSVLDIPCGDFKWMQKVDLSKIRYTGGDIVEDLIRENKERYEGRGNVKFMVIDLISDPLPGSDLLIVRDCLVHFSYKHIFMAVENIRLSGCKYLLATTFPDHHANHDIVTGEWRALNMQDKPFSFPKPIMLIDENCIGGDRRYEDKSLALWEISSL